MNPLQQYLAANRRRKAKLGDFEVDVVLASAAQFEQFRAEAEAGESTTEAQVAFAKRWLSVLVPDFRELEGQDIPPALLLEAFNAAVQVAFAAKKN